MLNAIERKFMTPSFHLSLGVKSIEASIKFFTGALNAKVLHSDPSGYVNLDLYGTQITLKQSQDISLEFSHFHFGVNLSLSDFDRLSEKILRDSREFVTMLPEVLDAGTKMERKKMYLSCPTGYSIELKGYK